MTTEEFINKAKNKHGDKYDYSKVIYNKSTEKVVIICKVHGEFQQTPHKHNQGCGCQKCGIDTIKEKATGTLQNFLDRAIKVHGNKYKYCEVIYINAKSKVTITCPIHGNFEQTPDTHTCGSGCPKCDKEAVSRRMTGNRRVTIKDFTERANTLHNNKYDYTKVNFVVTNEKVVIGCPIHGEFKLSVNKHLLGKECPKCTMHGRVQNGWSTSTWELAGKQSKNFEAYSVYVAKCFNTEETFYKIGKTFKQVEKRLQKLKEIGYTTVVVQVFTGTAEEMSQKEKEMHKENRANKYIPTKTFCGMQECYSKVKL